MSGKYEAGLDKEVQNCLSSMELMVLKGQENSIMSMTAASEDNFGTLILEENFNKESYMEQEKDGTIMEN